MLFQLTKYKLAEISKRFGWLVPVFVLLSAARPWLYSQFATENGNLSSLDTLLMLWNIQFFPLLMVYFGYLLASEFRILSTQLHRTRIADFHSSLISLAGVILLLSIVRKFGYLSLGEGHVYPFFWPRELLNLVLMANYGMLLYLTRKSLPTVIGTPIFGLILMHLMGTNLMFPLLAIGVDEVYFDNGYSLFLLGMVLLTSALVKFLIRKLGT
ncbi:MAG: hypothetical protein FWF59_04305 [Turicibacter sp.]|nr:hypothetical protein [Turicibacter sp.]